ncbi:MAG: hypothetical protein MUF42_03665 [Cytophagaceae bacterium]|jgi:hypothetical protein|nr:hypothetical protein [Cytophagaceae bacterium]
MMYFIQELKNRNEILFFFGSFCFILSIIFLILTRIHAVYVHQVNAWFKPFKFAVSLGIYSWTMAWYCYYLSGFNVSLFNWTVVFLWSFEIIYIALQASKGQLSHYNISTPVYTLLYTCMAIAATVVTVYTAYIGYLFFIQEFPDLPSHYVWAIRLGIVLFVIFSFEGFAMGSRLNHSVGGLNDNSNWFILGWSKTVGDLRVSHFIGMHAMQVLPLVSFYILKSTSFTVALAILYALLSVATLVQALCGRPVLQAKKLQ